MFGKKKNNDNNKIGKKSDQTKNRDKSYFAASRKKRKRNLMIVLPVIVVLAVLGTYAISTYSSTVSHAIKPGYGKVGSEHVHAAFAVKVNGNGINFTDSKYQVRSRYLHMENGDGGTLHRHATGVPIAEFFDSVKMNVTRSCLTLDHGTKYCSDGKNNLEFYVNGNKTNSIADYVLENNDRILIVYGEEPLEVKQDLDALRQQPIKG